MGRSTHVMRDPGEPGGQRTADPAVRPLRVVKGDNVRIAADERSVLTTEADLRAALEEAFRRGYHEGEHAGAGHAAAAARLLSERLTACQADLAEQVHRLLDLDTRLVVDLAVELAEWFVERSLAMDTDALVASVLGALKEADGADAVQLTVGPEHLEFLRVQLGTVVDALRADPAFGPGDFELVTSGPTIDRRFAVAVARFREELGAS
jgi:flagellar biosynthesis/type III secretory pathway protein FliH